jgi:penicillin-binding protein 1A
VSGGPGTHYRWGGMRLLTRLLVVVGTAGTGLALGLALLAPEVRGVLTAGEAGRPKDLVKLGELAQNSIVYGHDNKVLAVLHAEENRSPVPLSAVPAQVVNAILDVEDDGYWHHSGINLRSSLRALVTNVSAGQVRQGGSTITQQLVKNALLTPEKSVDRKVKEAVLAVRLEDKLSKTEILERYLNTVYFGNGAYGVQAAAETYFNTDVGALSAGQAAVLAGIIRNPVGYDPIRHRQAATARRNAAAERMVAMGHLGASEAAAVRAEPLPAQVYTPLPPPNDYFVEEVKQALLDDPRLGETPAERYNALFKGGLRIHTTLDPPTQRKALDARARILPANLTKGRFTSALVSVEPTTGYVRAMVAGDDFGTTKYNLATGAGGSGRQPGSSYKPFVLLAALEAGYGPNDIIDGTSPCTLTPPGFAPYTPGNYEGSAGGVMSLTDATAHSVNCAYARLGLAVGLDKVVDMANRLGLKKQKPMAYPSISLGAQEVTPLEMASAYATMANDGVSHAPRFVEKVTDRRGRVVFEGPDAGRRVVSAQVARVAMNVLRAVVERGTGTRARLPGRDMWGKTGTSQNHENAWFVGSTPQLTTAVWMGSPIGNVPMLNVGGIRVAGGTYPARIWAAYMGEAMKGLPALSFPGPDPRLIPASRFIGERPVAGEEPAPAPEADYGPVYEDPPAYQDGPRYQDPPEYDPGYQDPSGYDAGGGYQY